MTKVIREALYKGRETWLDPEDVDEMVKDIDGAIEQVLEKFIADKNKWYSSVGGTVRYIITDFRAELNGHGRMG